jgi:hypothetical protein
MSYVSIKMRRHLTVWQYIAHAPMIVLAAGFLHIWWGTLVFLDINTPGMNAMGWLNLVIPNETLLASTMILTSILAIYGIWGIKSRIAYTAALCPQQTLMWAICLLQHWGSWEHSHDWHTLIAMPAIDGLAIFHTLYMWTSARA